MSYPRAELLGRVERRRRFSVEQKLAILTEATTPGASLSAIARRHGLLPAQVYKWRRLAELGVIGVPGASELPSFVAVEIAQDVPSLPAPLPEDKSATVDSAPRRRRRKKAGVIDGRIEIDNNVVERAIRPLTLNRKNALFAGSDGGAEHWAVIASLIETCKLLGVDPLRYLTDAITRIVNGHPQNRLDDLMPWAYPATPQLPAVD